MKRRKVLKGFKSYKGKNTYKVGDHEWYDYPIFVEIDGKRFNLFALGYYIGVNEDGYWLCYKERETHYMAALREVD